MSETFSPVESCPVTFQDWTNRARVKCSSKHPYHCVEDEFSRTVEICVESIWIEPGYCPVYNTKAKKMDSQRCSGPNCPKEVYKSDDVSKYNNCQWSSTSTRVATTQSIRNPTSSGTSSNTAAIAGSVITILLVILLTVIGVIWWRNKSSKKLKFCCPGRANREAEENEVNEHLTDTRHEDQAKIYEEITALEKTVPVVVHMDIDFISHLVQRLCEHKSLALFGKWGSGKRTLAKQISLKLAKEKGLNIRIIREMSTPKVLASTRSTVLILDEPIKSQYRDRHNHDILNCLQELRFNAKENQSFQLAVFHCDDINITTELFSQASGNIHALFPQVYHVSIISTDKLREIADIKKENISADVLRKLSVDDRSSSMGCMLRLTLFLRNKSNELLVNPNTDPVEIVMNTLKVIVTSQSRSQRVQFKSLLRMTLLNQDIEKALMRNIIEDALRGEIREDTFNEIMIRECIEQLLQNYIEETGDGKSYRVIHDVITRCTLFTAMQYLDYTKVFNECDPPLLFDCIRLKTRKEKIKCPGEFAFDRQTLKIGVPTESFPSLAQSCMLRNEMMTMLRNFRIFENQKLQTEWINAQERLKNN